MIVSMRKMTFIGVEADKERFLARLQEVGIVHLLHPKEAAEPQDLVKTLARITETRKILSSKGMNHPPGEPGEPLSGQAVCQQREALAQRETLLQGEIAALKKEWSIQEVWGDFDLQQLEALRDRGLHLQFFRVSQKVFETLPLKGIHHRVAGISRGEVCFVTASLEPVALPVPEEKIPSKTVSTIRKELDARTAELERIEAEYRRLAAHLETLKRTEAELADLLEYQRAVLNAGSALDGSLFSVTCWSPLPEAELIAKIGPSFALHYFSEKPSESEQVPVLLSNKPAFDSGEDLVKVYSYPSYQDFDPSGFVLYCFAVFFGMIIGDAGYGLSLLAVTFLLQRKFKSSSPFAVRFFRLMYLLSASVTVYGVISAGYFGLQIDKENPLWNLCLLDVSTKEGQNNAMILSIIIGMIHISLSHLIQFKNTRAYASLGWIITIWAGYFLVSGKMSGAPDNPAATYGTIIGLVIVFIFSSRSRNPIFRILEGLNGLLGIVQVFSDVLSYLRLFALGIATVYMAQTFNTLAKGIVEGVPYAGWVLATLVLIAGHSVNLLLGVMGGVIHGLRLNFLEWYRWCFTGDGLIYKPFCLRKTQH
ncbi:V-type ATP synthase subunit I [Desulfatiglans anilini]|uniref:V-type ATP synthase subunit I n=1 Tax=Desulfatiglans anilini TaxID=90728 RepID=UPI00041D28DB|nr:hypothetical protein [Desulfatiglans anilini]